MLKTKNVLLPRTCKQDTGGRKKNKKMKTEGSPHRNNPIASFSRLGNGNTLWIIAQILHLAGISHQVYTYPLHNCHGLTMAKSEVLVLLEIIN